jgi:hypothetical protein
MIYQISSVQAKTQALAHLNKGLIQARHIQARLKESAHTVRSTDESSSRNFTTLLPVNSWFD